MAYEGPNRLGEWYEALREQVPVVRKGFSDWREQVREEPSLIWQTPAVRYVVYGVGAAITLWVVTFAIALITPPPPKGARAQATTADFHVVCTESGCGHHFVMHRDFGFDDFPVKCGECGKLSGYSARPCNSAKCGGRWVAPVVTETGKSCPKCKGIFP